MNEEKKCLNCGTVNTGNSVFCVNCGTRLDSNTPSVSDRVENTNLDNSDKAANKLGIISLILYLVGSGALTSLTFVLSDDYSNYLSSLFGFCPLVGIVLMIYGRIKYPNNRLLKIVMWVIIVIIILEIILFILFLIMCSITCGSLESMG